MNLAWCVIALALTGADDPGPTQRPTTWSASSVDNLAVDVWPLTIREAIRVAFRKQRFAPIHLGTQIERPGRLLVRRPEC